MRIWRKDDTQIRVSVSAAQPSVRSKDANKDQGGFFAGSVARTTNTHSGESDATSFLIYVPTQLTIKG